MILHDGLYYNCDGCTSFGVGCYADITIPPCCSGGTVPYNQSWMCAAGNCNIVYQLLSLGGGFPTINGNSIVADGVRHGAAFTVGLGASVQACLGCLTDPKDGGCTLAGTFWVCACGASPPP